MCAISSEDMYGKVSRQSRTAGATISATSTIPTGHASHQRPSFSPSRTSPNAASSGRQNANIKTRSGGYHPVAAPSPSPSPVISAHDNRKRRANPCARKAPASASALVMKGE